MTVMEDKTTLFSDIDGTLVNVIYLTDSAVVNDDDLIVDWYGKVRLEPIFENIENLKRWKDNGGLIVVWHGGSTEYAKKIINKLNLEKYVDLVVQKPTFYMDDMNPEYILGTKLE